MTKQHHHSPRLPLSGVRVTDLTMFWVGPFSTMFLANMGAQVIKIESAKRFDSVRVMGGARDKDPLEWATVFNGTNVNKLGITLDLDSTEGREMLKRFIAVSDVVSENFSARVGKNLGITWDFVHKANPSAIMVSMPGFGHGGPWENYVGFGPQFEQASGITYMSGYPDTTPMMQGGMSDPLAGLFGAVATMTALEHRRKTGRGQFIDMSSAEAITHMTSATLMDYTMNGRVRERMANKHSAWSPHGAFRCKGEDKWVAIVCRTDEEFAILCDAIGKPRLKDDLRFADVISRWDNQDALGKSITEWTKERTGAEIMALLQGKGVMAADVVDYTTVLQDPQLKARDFWWWIVRPVNGPEPMPYYGFPPKLSKTPAVIRKAPPRIGEDNDFVFSEILNLSPDEMQGLKERNIIGTTVKFG